MPDARREVTPYRATSVENGYALDVNGHILPRRTSWICAVGGHVYCRGECFPPRADCTLPEWEGMTCGYGVACECSCHPVVVVPDLRGEP